MVRLLGVEPLAVDVAPRLGVPGVYQGAAQGVVPQRLWAEELLSRPGSRVTVELQRPRPERHLVPPPGQEPPESRQSRRARLRGRRGIPQPRGAQESQLVVVLVVVATPPREQGPPQGALLSRVSWLRFSWALRPEPWQPVVGPVEPLGLGFPVRSPSKAVGR